MNRPALNIPDGQSGEWRIETHFIPEDDARRAGIAPGSFRALKRGVVCVMNNSEQEVAELKPFAERAAGHVLINGLGLGLALGAALRKPEVVSVVVVDNSSDVIALVGPHFQDARFRVVCADALTYEPDSPIDVVWHDIWPTRGIEHDAQMRELCARYSDKCRWQGVWSRPDLTGETCEGK